MAKRRSDDKLDTSRSPMGARATPEGSASTSPATSQYATVAGLSAAAEEAERLAMLGEDFLPFEAPELYLSGHDIAGLVALGIIR